MNRLSFLLVALVGILAGALGYAQWNRVEPGPDEATIRAVVEQVLAEQPVSEPVEPAEPAVAEIDPAVLNPMIEEFLMSDPRLLQRMSVALETTLRTEELERSQLAIAEYRDQIFNDPNAIVIGNPDGDVTLVEFFDYNCGYCRAALPDMVALLDEDPNLRIVLKEFPILSNASIEAARVGVLVSQTDADYWAFHQTLFSSRGQVDRAVALAAAAEQGLSTVELELRLTEDMPAEIRQSYQIAQALGITGTPTFIIGNEIIPGSIGLDELRARISDMRECGESQCS